MRRDKPLIQLPPGAAQLAKQEGEQAILLHLDEGSKQVSVWADYFHTAMREAIRERGLPGVEEKVERDSLLADAGALADAAAAIALHKRSSIVAEVVTEMKVRDVPDHMLWAAKRTGVEIVLAPAAQAIAEEPVSLIKTGH